MQEFWYYTIPALILLLVAGAYIVFASIQLRRANRKNMHLYRSIVETSVNPVFVFNPDGTITYANPAFETWSGYSKRELTGTNLYDLAPYLQSKDVQDSIRTEYYWSGSIDQKHKNGSPLNAFIVLYPSDEGSGRGIEYIGIAIDLREHRIFDVEKRNANILDGTPDGILIVQYDKIVFANRAILQMMNAGSPSEIAVHRFLGFISPQSRHSVEEIYRRGLDGEESLDSTDAQMQTRDGNLVDIQLNAAPTIWSKDRAVLITMRDVSSQKNSEREQAQWLWEQEMLSTIERQLVSTVDLNDVLDQISIQAKSLARADLSGVITIDAEKNLYRWLSVQGEEQQYQRKFMPLGNSAKRFYNEKEPRVAESLRENGIYSEEDFPLLVDEGIETVAQFPLMKGAILFGHLLIGFRKRQDISEKMLKLLSLFSERATVAIMNAELYDQLVKQTRHLQQMFEARMLAQEEERRRIAAELHDSLGQVLTSIKLHFDVLEDSDQVKGPEGIKQIREIKNLLDNAIGEARNISYDLRPSILDDFGLVPALEVLCDKFSIRSGITVHFQAHNLDARLNMRLETALYRIVQEALNNAQKHAEATEVNVHLIRTPDSVNLVVEDNGKGFDIEELEHRQYPGADGVDFTGMGLVSMRERTESFHGSFTIDTTPGKGTDIMVEIPLAETVKA